MNVEYFVSQISREKTTIRTLNDFIHAVRNQNSLKTSKKKAGEKVFQSGFKEWNVLLKYDSTLLN